MRGPAHPAEDRLRFAVVMGALGALLVWGVVLSANLGAVAIPWGEAWTLLGRGLWLKLASLIPGSGGEAALSALVHESAASRILFGIRLPRAALAAVLGGALSLSGLLLQSFFRNPIAGPFVLGISSGAKMVVSITTVFLARRMVQMTSAAMVLSAFLGALIIVGVVLLCSRRMAQMSRLLVVGVMVGYICSAVTDVCVTFAQDQEIAQLTGWSMGSFSGASWASVGVSAWICLPCLLGAWLLSKPIGAYALGETYAGSLGLNVRVFRTVLILLSSLLAACVTAFAGPVSFVGIAVPHITRSLLGSARPARVIPAAFLCGAVFCVFCDLIARTVLSPTELSIGTVTSVFGAPVVIWMLFRRRREQM